MRHGSRLGRMLIVLLALAGATGTQATASTSVAVAGSFVGKIEGTTMAIAIVADQPTAEGQPRTISAYLCNGSSLSAWLTGQLPGNSGLLTSADHKVQVKLVSLTPLSATGVLALSGSRQYPFTALRAVGVAGLYDVAIVAGAIRGSSSTGVTLNGRLGTADGLAGTSTVKVTAKAGGQTVDLVAPARRLKPGTYRWIVLADRTLVGANTLGPAAGSIGARTTPRPTGGKVVRISAGSAGQKGYDDAKCQGLASKWNKLVATASKNLKAGGIAGRAAAAAANAAADDVYREMDDHCVVTAPA